MSVGHRWWCVPLLCGLSACGRFGFESVEIEGDSQPSTSPMAGEDAASAQPDAAAVIPFDGGLLDGGIGDSSSKDAARNDASLSDAAPASDASRSALGCDAPPQGSVWCADFDTQIPGGSYQDAFRGDTSLVSTLSYRGAGSLEAHVWRSRGYAALSADLTGYTATTVHARGYLFVSSGIVTDDFTVFHLGHWSTPLGGTDIDVTAGKLESYSYASGTIVESGVDIPRDRWFCLQVSIELAESTGSVRVKIDGNQIIDAPNLATLPAEGLTDFAMGLPWTGSKQPELSVFIDEVAVGEAPIDCL